MDNPRLMESHTPLGSLLSWKSLDKLMILPKAALLIREYAYLSSGSHMYPRTAGMPAFESRKQSVTNAKIVAHGKFPSRWLEPCGEQASKDKRHGRSSATALSSGCGFTYLDYGLRRGQLFRAPVEYIFSVRAQSIGKLRFRYREAAEAACAEARRKGGRTAAQ